MKKVDGFYLYQIGANIRELKSLKGSYKEENDGSSYVDAYYILSNVERTLTQFLDSKDYRLKTSLLKGNELKESIRKLKEKISSEEDKTKKLLFTEVYPLHDALDRFEAVLASEFALLDMYVITKKGGYDITDLMMNGDVCFPKDLKIKVPEAIADIKTATKCIAVSLPTAAGFHFHRANEAVLRRYWDSVTSNAPRPKNSNMGTYIAQMETKNVGDIRVRSALKDLKDLHRNPLIHPDHTLEDLDEAIALMNHIHTVIVHMLKAIKAPKVERSKTLADYLGASLSEKAE